MKRHGKIDSGYIYRPPSFNSVVDWSSWEEGGNQECNSRLGAGQLSEDLYYLLKKK